jgi:tRNA (guanine37-N1)-methyltransferase
MGFLELRSCELAMQKESPCLKVPKIFGQKTIVLADKLGLQDKQLDIKKDSTFICVPLVREPTKEETALFKHELADLTLEVQVFQEQEPREKTLHEALAKTLSPYLLASLPHAFDVVGDIAIIEIPLELKQHEKVIGNTILETHKNVKTVLTKASAISGTYRLREFTVIAGEPRTRTVHKEFGCTYYVDVAKAYFSPRLSHEHKRVADQVRDGEVVTDLFAGVGPFAVLIGKNKTVKVYAIDINPEAVELLKKNVLVNRVQGNVFPVLGEARQVIHSELHGNADRVIMNLPESADEFIDVACETLKPSGGIVHFYSFLRQPDSIDALKNRFMEAVEKADRKVKEFAFVRVVRETAPYQQQIALDARVI